MLAEEHKTWLRGKLRNPGSAQVYRRVAALLAVHKGRSPNEVAEVLGVTRQTVYNWLNSYDPNQPGVGLEDAPRPGRPGIGVGEMELLLDQALQKSPRDFGYDSNRWTTALLRKHVINLQGPGVSDETVRRRLRRLGYSWVEGCYVRPRVMEPAQAVLP